LDQVDTLSAVSQDWQIEEASKRQVRCFLSSHSTCFCSNLFILQKKVERRENSLSKAKAG
jgi:hypothetical protein